MRHEKVSVGHSSPIEQVDMLKAEQNSGNREPTSA